MNTLTTSSFRSKLLLQIMVIYLPLIASLLPVLLVVEDLPLAYISLLCISTSSVFLHHLAQFIESQHTVLASASIFTAPNATSCVSPCNPFCPLFSPSILMVPLDPLVNIIFVQEQCESFVRNRHDQFSSIVRCCFWYNRSVLCPRPPCPFSADILQEFTSKTRERLCLQIRLQLA